MCSQQPSSLYLTKCSTPNKLESDKAPGRWRKEEKEGKHWRIGQALNSILSGHRPLYIQRRIFPVELVLNAFYFSLYSVCPRKLTFIAAYLYGLKLGQVCAHLSFLPSLSLSLSHIHTHTHTHTQRERERVRWPDTKNMLRNTSVYQLDK